ncbi:hypothetical protein N5I28_18870 [Pseudomonas mosselii]|uniref:hypothetical protein n=1 Tax=Pseudomonas mosselii TaxID=78327 RepID=UPI0024479AE9|nr:hypothetical protein [Pseudomonas mosselii]MDH1511816.1 hypothetical protein [Pseudomonas mosselii]
MPEILKLERGRTYRGKKPACVRSCGLVNDRTVIYVGVDEVQYDGPSVAPGRHYPRMPIKKFLEWVGHDVTDELPAGEYASWPPAKQAAS